MWNPVLSFHCSQTAPTPLCAAGPTADGAGPPGSMLINGHMPRLDSFKFVHALCSLLPYAGVTLVIISGSDGSEDRRRRGMH